MNSQDVSAAKSPRRELHGPRPTPLRLHKDSHKIKKPPLAPQPPSQPHAPPRQPIIIYTVSPKIIHTTPGDFMNLVQRLTGSSSQSSSSSSDTVRNDPPKGNISGGVISPAARFAAIEKARSPLGKKQHQSADTAGVEGMDMSQAVEGQGTYHGILSPGPASLSPIPASFFSPSSDPSFASFFHDLSPMLHSSRNFMEGSFMASPPSNFFVSPGTPSIDLFNNFLG